MGSDKPITDIQAETAPRRRPGRPRMIETGQEAANDQARRTRMRLAQRSYRSRKQSALVSAKARAESLEVALDGSIDEFIKFYEHVSQRGKELPPGVMTQLNRTAMNIVSIARKARMEKSMLTGDQNQSPEEDPAASADDMDADHEPTGYLTSDLTVGENQTTKAHRYHPHQRQYGPFTSSKPAPVSQRLLLACLTRAIALLQLGNFSVVAINPAMILPLQLERAEKLLERTARRLSGNPSAFFADCQYGDSRNAALPKMMRLIEGDLNSLTPRSSPPNLQNLHFGRTRTMLNTAISELQGEWLEAPDVEEYLEQRGIFVRMGSPSDIISLSAPMIEDQPSPEAARLGMLRPHAPLVDISDFRKEPRTKHAAIPEHDFTIFGKAFREDQTVPTGRNNFALSEWYPEMRAQTDSPATNQQAQESLQITINIDKLVQGLADKAVCLGPCPGIKRVHVDEAIRGSVSDFQQ
ncbi:hypothetical protein THAR02_02313 [Trichoderma harzianum]|uniref:BZIP domain-containing protein n=1 Tax=Trichoderma harzianum TaxID=5544 RepID=A0A0G0A035_TRIHA|nr:hypothetical protein THAR02_02313 [Trichoderma harzianum]